MHCGIRVMVSNPESESESRSVMSDSLQPPWTIQSMNSLGQNTGVCSLSLLQGIFPTQGLNPGLPHCRWILYQLSHKGSPRMLEWVAYPFSSAFSPPRNQTGVLHCGWILYQLSYEGSPQILNLPLKNFWTANLAPKTSVSSSAG